jgi:hypothetical protein
VQSAVGDFCGVANFTLDLSTPLHNKLSAGADSSGPKTGVSITTLDAAAESFGIERIDLLKIDVEGAEPFVLKGARKLLEQRRVECLFVEFIIEFMEGMGADVGAVYQSLVEMGYDFYAITPEGKVGERLDRQGAIDNRRAGPDAKERDYWGLNVVIKKRK